MSIKVRLAAVLLLALLFTLAGCGGNKAGGAKGSAKDSSTSEPSKQAAKGIDFPNRDISLIVPFSPGGGFDTNARLLAPFLEKYLPKKINVVVKNVTGGQSKIGITDLYKAKPDGYTLAIFNIPGNVTPQIVGGVEYDLNKVTWLGRITDTAYLAALSPKSRFKTPADLKKADLVKAGVVGISTTAGFSVAITAQEMGFKVNLISHDGSQDSMMSAIRGDVDLVINPYSTVRKFVVESKDLNPAWVYTEKRQAEIPDTPTISEVGYPGLLGVVRLDYLVGAPPGMPPEVSGVLREAFKKAVNDPELQKMIKEASKQPVNPATAEEAEQIVKKAFEGYGKYKDLILKYSAK